MPITLNRHSSVPLYRQLVNALREDIVSGALAANYKLPPERELAERLGVLVRHGVEFVVVGGVAAVLNGAPINALDLDILHHRTPENVGRLLAALTELDATFRIVHPPATPPHRVPHSPAPPPPAIQHS